MVKSRFLTKSKFKLALECPTKLYYEGKQEYANQKIEDSFLLALADGGYQVGELAKCYFPSGYQIDTLDYDEALRQTNELLQRERVIIYEAAVQYKKFFVRIDILIKDKEHIEIVEVKAKSFDKSEGFLDKNGDIYSKWKPYLYDVVFQEYVVTNALKKNVAAFLMLADKQALCSTNGLNQKFRLGKNENGKRGVIFSPNLSKEDLAVPILAKINVDEHCSLLYGETHLLGTEEMGFEEYINRLADNYIGDEKNTPVLSRTCKKCEYKATEKERMAGLKSGLDECWKEKLDWIDEDFKELSVFEIGNLNYRKADKLIQQKRMKMKDVDEEDIAPKSDNKPGISQSERQWLQVQKVKSNDKTTWIDRENLLRKMESWVYPLHFIDFETAALAIPFNKGRHPYEGIAFQFSHHVVYEDGKIEHYGQYLNVEPGVFPNYEFIRELKRQLELDEGSVFRYASHENTYLNMIYEQLIEDNEDIHDRQALCSFIRSISQSRKRSSEHWIGNRNMIDMYELVKRYYYDPYTKGSNSIKKVLPAILNGSKFLQSKYSKPIYGAEGGIRSLNYKDWSWLKFEDGSVVDPYKLLPKMFKDISDKDFELLSEDDEVHDGGAALTAYARLQFTEMSDYEREEIKNALLRYCELDTLAMVMIYEGWRDLMEIN